MRAARENKGVAAGSSWCILTPRVYRSVLCLRFEIKYITKQEIYLSFDPSAKSPCWAAKVAWLPMSRDAKHCHPEFPPAGQSEGRASSTRYEDLGLGQSSPGR